MKQVLSTTDRSFVESALIALDVEGIEAAAKNDTGLPFIPVAVVVPDDADYDRALAVLRGLQHTGQPSILDRRLSRRVWRITLLVVVVAVFLLCIDSIG